MSGLATLMRVQRGRAASIGRHFTRSSSGTSSNGAIADSPLENPAQNLAQNPAQTVAHLLAASPAERYLGRLSLTHTVSIHVKDSDPLEQIKAEIARLLREKSFDALLATVSKWTSPSLPVPWQSVLSQREMAHVLANLVKHQNHMLSKASSAKMMRHRDAAMQMAHVRELREQIRAVYAQMLIPGAETPHLYAKGNGVFTPAKAGQHRPFNLSLADYENLIKLELNNGKLDLALRWFQHMETHGASGAAGISHLLWLLRFRVYGNGQLSLWRVELSSLSEYIVNPRQSVFKNDKKWLELFNEYDSQQKLLGIARSVFDVELVSVMLSLIAYGKNVDQMQRLIQANWGFYPDGELVPGFDKPASLDPLFPNIHVLTAVVVAMLFNQQYVACMAYINAFQAHYSLDIAGAGSSNFWDQIFRWAEIASRFSEARAFNHFISETKSPALAGLQLSRRDEYPAVLEKAKQSADFDYERFLAFIGDLRRQRHGLLGELWKCFHESTPSFSVRPYRTYMLVAEELLMPLAVLTPADSVNEGASLCYEILTRLAEAAEMHAVAPCSFNAPMMASTAGRLRALYVQTMQILIRAKGESGSMGEIPHIVRKWSLGPEMERSLNEWAQKHENRYLQRMLELEKQRLREEDEEGFLDLI